MLGCKDPLKAAETIAREELPALSLAADKTPGGGAEGPAEAAPSSPKRNARPSTTAPGDGQSAPDGEMEEGDDGAKASPGARATSSRGRHRRARSGTEARGRGNAGGALQGESAEERTRGASALKILRLVVSRGVTDREPFGPATSFSSAEVERLYAFVELSNEARIPSEVGVTFTSPSGVALQRVRLDVGSLKRWRTWASTRKARAPGVWSVAVSDADGNELARTSFTMTE